MIAIQSWLNQSKIGRQQPTAMYSSISTSSLKARGSDTKVYIIENKCSSDLKEAMKKYEIDFQLDPSQMHKQNAAEQSIKTCKKHFIYGFWTTDSDFPIRKWDRLLSKWVITLNLLRNFRVNPALSEYAYLFGPYDFNKSPMAPPVTCVIVHDKPVKLTVWVHHGTPGWYIGPSLDHYRSMQCYMPTIVIVRITDTLQYIPKAFAFPKTTTEDYLH